MIWQGLNTFSYKAPSLSRAASSHLSRLGPNTMFRSIPLSASNLAVVPPIEVDVWTGEMKAPDVSVGSLTARGDALDTVSGQVLSTIYQRG